MVGACSGYWFLYGSHYFDGLSTLFAAVDSNCFLKQLDSSTEAVSLDVRPRHQEAGVVRLETKDPSTSSSKVE